MSKQVHLRGFSTDTKPTLGADFDGSDYFELDTEQTYIYNSNQQYWAIKEQTGDNMRSSVGVKEIKKTATSGLVDTYTIFYTNGATANFTVTNGKNGKNGKDGKDGKDGSGANVGKGLKFDDTKIVVDENVTTTWTELWKKIVANQAGKTTKQLTSLKIGNELYEVTTGVGVGVEGISEENYTITIKLAGGDGDKVTCELTDVKNDINKKQNKISDLAEIRSGAKAGSTAVQPNALNEYAKKTEMPSVEGLASEDYVDAEVAKKQDKLTAGSNITIDENNVISATGGGAGGKTYESGNGITVDNTNNIISIDTDVTATKDDLEAKQDKITDLDTYAKKADIPDSYTKTESDDKYQVKGEYATTSDVNAKQDKIDDLSAIRAGAEAGATAVQPDDLVSYAKKTDLPTKTSDLTNDSGFLTEHQSLADYSTTVQMNQAIADHHDDTKQAKLTAGANIYIDENNVISATGGEGGKTYISGNGIIVNNTNNTISADTTVLSTKDDLSSKQDTIEDLSTIRSGAEAGATAVQPGDLTEYAKKTDIPTVPTKISAFENDECYLKEHQSLADYSTTVQMNQAIANYHDNTKQDNIENLDDIKEGAALGKTALQSFTETDPTVPAYVKAITEANIASWNAKSEFSGSYNDLTDKPEGLATETYVNNHHDATKLDKATNEEVPDGYLVSASVKTTEESTTLTIIKSDGSKVNFSGGGGAATYSDGEGIKINDDDSTISIDKNVVAVKTDIPTIPTKVSAFENDANYLTSFTETDPTVPAHIKAITEENITSWTNKSDFSGSYNDLTDKPTIPSIEGLATETYVNTEVAKKQDIIDEEHKLDYNLIANTPTIPSLDGYATETYVNNHHDSSKQDTITDLATIRDGAAKGATALQSVPEEYAKKADIPDTTKMLTTDNYATTLGNVYQAKGEYVVAEAGKGLSTNDYDANAVAEVAKIAGKQDALSATNKLDTAFINTTDDTQFVTKAEKTAWNAAEANIIDAITVNGTAVTVTDKTAAITIPAAAEYSLVKDTSSEDYAAVYHLTKDGDNVGAAINIPKDMVVESGSVETCTEADKPVTGYKVGDKYIDLVIANKTSSHLYILVSDLIDVYTEGSGIKITNNQISVDTTTIATKKSVDDIVDGTTTVAKATSTTNAAQLADGTNTVTAAQAQAVITTVGDTTSGLVKDVKDLKDAGATKVEASETNGNIKINGTETTVYTEVANTVHDDNYKHITISATDGVTDGTNTYIAPKVEASETNGNIKVGDEEIEVYRGGDVNSISYLTTAPTEDNLIGLKFVVLSEEPDTKYNGYVYIITE